MKRILLAATTTLITFSIFAQTKKMLVSSVTSYRTHNLMPSKDHSSPLKDGKLIYPNQLQELSNKVHNNRDFDQTPLSNKLDVYLREDFFVGFPVELVSKSELLNNEKYQAYESPYYAGKGVFAPSQESEPKKEGGLKGKLGKLAALQEEPSTTSESEATETELYRPGGDPADGYTTFAWAFPGSNEDDDIRSYFPEADVFIYGIYSGSLASDDYAKSATFNCNVQLLMYKRGDKRNHKSFQFLTSVPIEDYSFEKYVSDPDIEAIYSLREGCLDNAIGKMKERKEKRTEQFEKWVNK